MDTEIRLPPMKKLMTLNHRNGMANIAVWLFPQAIHPGDIHITQYKI